MVFKLIDAADARPGNTIMIEGQPYVVRSNDISKSGKHGASKCRIEALSLTGGKKKVLACPGHERFDVPNVDKRKAQVLTVTEGRASVMDLETYETIDMDYDEDIKDQIAVDLTVEYWDIEGIKIIKRVL